MACTQPQIKKFPWTPKRAAALLNEAMTDFIEKGADFKQTIDGLSARHGIKREIIAEGLYALKGVPRKLTDDMWVRNQERRTVEQQARQFTQDFKKPGWQKKAEQIANFPRRAAIIGHFGVFTKTHLSDQAFYNPQAYAKNFVESYSLVTKAGKARLERDLTVMTGEPEYKAAVRSGLDVKPGGGGLGAFKTETAETTGTQKPSLAGLAFDRLRLTRYGIFKNEYHKLSPEEQADPEQLKAVANVLNNDTGTTAVRNRFIKFLMFAPRLFPAQLKHTFVDIPKSLIETGFGLNYKKAAPGARYVARKTAILASTYTAMLAANEGAGLAFGKNFQPNITQPSRNDWLRLKIFGYGIPVSPTVELMKVPIQMMAAARAAKAGDNVTAVALMRGLNTVLGRQNPLFAMIEQTLFGEETGTGRPTPLPGLVTSPAPSATKPKMTWTEFLGSKFPIPAANLVHEIYDEMREQGMDHPTAKTWVQALATSVAEGITGYHGSPTREDFGFPTKTIRKGQPGYGEYQKQEGAARKKYKLFKQKEGSKPQPKELFGVGG